MPRKLDPFWEFGDPDGGFDRLHLTCKLCGQHMAGGVYRLKYHLAQIPGHEVGPCNNTNPEIIRRAMNSLEEMEAAKVSKAALKSQITKFGVERESGSGSSASASSTGSPAAASSFFVPRTTHGAQPSISSLIKKKEKEEADRLLGKLFLWSDIPFNVAKNNPFYQAAIDAIAVVGPGYKAPTYHDLKGRILQNEKADCTKRLEDLRASWEVTGCTVMSDGWTDQRGRSLLNFLVSCPKGTMFIKSVDASAHVKDARLLCDLLDVFIMEVGPQNVVQIITDNAANYVLAGKMLMERYPSIFWTPCAAHCLDLMLEDIRKLDFVKDIVESSKRITKFIYNHGSVLHLMRTFTNKKELVRPAITRFATTFISLQSLLNSKWDLKRMFLSDEWRALTISRKSEGQAICRLVSYQEDFWAGVEEVCSISEPLVKVLRLVDGEKPAMGYLYEAMDRAKEAVRSYYDDKGDDGFQRQLLLWEVIDDRWNNTLHRPIHAAGLFLNPAFAYSCGFVFDAEVMDGFFTCVQKMVPSPSDRADISKEMEVYRMAGGTLSFDMAVQDRTAKMPDAWWRSYGGRVPKLQKFAIRILSQTCSASGCERNWSAFEKIHTKRRNRLEGQRLNDMVYVYYNLRLWVRQLERTPDVEAISLDAIDTTAEWRVEAERPVMESAPDWIEQEVVEGEDEEEDEEEQQQQQEEEEQEEEVTPPTTTTGRGRGLPPLAPSGSGSRSGASFFTSRARQSPLPVPPASSSRGKGKAVVFSRKRGRGNQ